MPKVSVIIPVHNGAKLLSKTAAQILNQTFRDLELILVENGSSDNSWQVCQQLRAQDNRVMIAQSEPSTSFARKKGVELAKGEYILFSDHDDRYIDEHAIASMVRTAEETGCDIVEFGHFVNHFGKTTVWVPDEERIIGRKELLETFISGPMGGYGSKMLESYVWSKIFKSTPIKAACGKIAEPLIKTEDLYLNSLVFFEESVQTVALSKECFYVYNTGIGGSGAEDAGEKLFQEYRIVKPLILQLAEEHGAGKYPIVKCHRETLNFLHTLISDFIVRGMTKDEVINRIREYTSWDFVKTAAEYFINDNQTWDDHIMRLSRIDDSEAYYNMCLSDLGNLRIKKLKHRVKWAIKSSLRWMDQL